MEWQYSLDKIREMATTFWEAVGATKVFAFQGPMGAGKTTFIRELCAIKGVKDSTGSPTFSIINEYEYIGEGTKKIVYHMDLYRLKNEDEALQAGVEDCLYSGHICLVEWPEKAPGLFPDNTLHISIELLDDKTRRLKIADI
ncbi:MAG: tRNA (adenosine(37)-N6)-threonylcarbamoyltransferase complex ATPase subunit type 1 TsaE [Chitinophagaceae bacterium]|nr:tRNA (adenosine(37)-N6)-threonylcarbamoyltransferase complex ATPase subunit type 1 TsaE [Chitinophagaceae bacterium]MBL0132256.1 tRNA (adenosine(37)-N6)-threonylcarbamoyltransferase complex ATPase subunit type 1 TsaE [Chitinophagaceae bacterium]MBL0271721.1 tRNA (adenosine(37)-N6)-threonylcarbamoyltransferase complex ATPase subunit type 1 TsaE [Chitinophagaceae bacterium]